MIYKFDSPFFVNTKFNYFCEGCKQEELEIETEAINTGYSPDDYPARKAYTLTCSKYELCKKLVQRLRYEKETNNEQR